MWMEMVQTLVVVIIVLAVILYAVGI